MGIFSYDSPFMNFLTKACEFMLVSLLCLLFSIPVITMGAAITSSFYVGMKLVRGEDAGFFKPFVKGFKENFKQSTIIWIIELIVGGFLSYDWFLIYHNGFKSYNRVLLILLLVLTIYVLMAFIAIFALVARFDISTKEAIKGALAYTYVNVPRMLFVLVLIIFPTAASLKYPNWLMAIWPIGSAAALYIISYNFSKSFKKLELHIQGCDEEDIVEKEFDNNTETDNVQAEGIREKEDEKTGI